jgi:hypothetical protein
MKKIVTRAGADNAAFGAVAAAFRGDPQVTGGRMFGAAGLKVGGKVFAMLVKERLVVKLPETRIDALLRSGEGTRFDPGHGRVMREWVALLPSTAARWPALAEEARGFVAGGRAPE